MEMFGYAGKILRVDLSTGKIEKEPLDPGVARNFVGGYSANAKLLYENVRGGVDPLSPENAIIVGAGPFVGTALAGAAKTEWTMKSPLTGGVATASSGGFGAPLKWAGYDHLLITGRAERPVYLTIFDDEVEIHDATGVWGKDLFDASDALWASHGGDCAIACIGTAGENKVYISQALVDKRSTLGRQGTGAVFGSKNLKAIVVRGTKGVKVADKGAFGKRVDDIHAQYMKDPLRERWMALGTVIALEGYPEDGNALWKNWRETFPLEQHIHQYGVDAFLRVREISLPCPGCPLGCKVLRKIREGEFAGLENPIGCNVGSVLGLGTRFDLGGYNNVIRCSDLTNRTGVDNIEFGFILDFILELQEQGIIGKEVTDGMVLKRDFDTLYTWIGKVARREGFGDVIADGYNGIFKVLGEEVKKYAVQVKGSSPDFDIRGTFGTENLGAAVGPHGAHASVDLGPTAIRGRSPVAIKRYGMRVGIYPDEERVFSGPCGFNVGRLAKHLETWNITLNSLGVCNRPPIGRLYTLLPATELYYITTGIKLEPQELLSASDRGFVYFKMFNVREGFTRKDDALPERWFSEPLIIEGDERRLEDYCRSKFISKEDFERILDDYYDEWGWDTKTGVPKERTLFDLGLKDFAVKSI